VSGIEQQNVQRDDAGLQSSDRIDDRGEIGARQRIAALPGHGIIVDGDDGDQIRRGLFSARDQTKIGQPAFRAVEKWDVTVPVTQSQHDGPERRQHERNQGLDGSCFHGRSLSKITGQHGRAMHRFGSAANA
jgi:hypothetical protein